jgi:hypothetical protein
MWVVCGSQWFLYYWLLLSKNQNITAGWWRTQVAYAGLTWVFPEVQWRVVVKLRVKPIILWWSKTCSVL